MLRNVFAALCLCALLGAAPGCGAVDEVIEARLCRDAAGKICDKWFSCWPATSAVLWGSVSNCHILMDAWCSESEAWSGCDIDNGRLSDCNNQISGSVCGALPASCTALFNCYKANP